jgi:hypothetical protein
MKRQVSRKSCSLEMKIEILRATSFLGRAERYQRIGVAFKMNFKINFLGSLQLLDQYCDVTCLNANRYSSSVFYLNLSERTLLVEFKRTAHYTSPYTRNTTNLFSDYLASEKSRESRAGGRGRQIARTKGRERVRE